MRNFFIIISGPTAVGKTDFVDQLVTRLSFSTEIVNADMGQLYTPLSIGTAKPDYKSKQTAHHLFDVIDSPTDFTATEFRELLLASMQELWARGVIPIVTGGSGFYLQTLFFKPQGVRVREVRADLSLEERLALWEQLNTADPKRAMSIHKHDTYRVRRALDLHDHGLQPSEQQPVFEPIGRAAFYFLTRDRDDLYERINSRTSAMLQEGWLSEVASLTDEWRSFLLAKKLIGYPEIIAYNKTKEAGFLTDDSFQQLESRIAKKTRAYGKRQQIFWKMMKRKLAESDPQREFLLKHEEVNLTLGQLEVYLEHLSNDLEALYKRL